MVTEREKQKFKSMEDILDTIILVFEKYTGQEGSFFYRNNEASMETLFKGDTVLFRKALMEIADQLGVSMTIKPGLEFRKCKVYINVSYFFYMKLCENQDLWEKKLLPKFGGCWMEDLLPIEIPEKNQENS